MKSITITILILLLSFYSGQAQVIKKNKPITISEKDTVNSIFFHQNPEIQDIRIVFYTDNKKMAYIYFNDDPTYMKRAYFELDYIVDSFVFFKKYGSITIPYFPDLMNNSEHIDLKIYSMRLKRDTVRYTLYAAENDYSKMHIFGDAVKSKFDINQFKQRITSYRGKLNPVDSVIVFRGAITENGILNNLELWVGEQNPYTNFVRDELLLQKNNWTPALYWENMRKWPSDIRIYIQWNSNKTLTFLTSPRKFYNITGK